MQLRHILSEAIMGNREYPIPQTTMQLMGDFYLLDLLQQPGERNVPTAGARTIQYELAGAEATLLPFLRKHLMLALGYSISCECRHLVDAVNWKQFSDNPNVWFAAIIDAINYNYEPDDAHDGDDEDAAEAMQNDALAILAKLGASPEILQFWKLHTEPSDQGRPDINESEPFISESTQIANELFGKVNWADQYGGPPWVMACELFNALQAASKPADIRMISDRIFQLQHNTGNVLNKNPDYDGRWILNLLNTKYTANDPEQIMRFCSPFMRQLGSYVLGTKYGRGWDADKYGERDDAPPQPELVMKQLKDWLNSITGIFAHGAFHIIINDTKTDQLYGGRPIAELMLVRDHKRMTLAGMVNGTGPDGRFKIDYSTVDAAEQMKAWLTDRLQQLGFQVPTA